MAKKVGSVYAEIRADIKKLQSDFNSAQILTVKSSKKMQETLDTMSIGGLTRDLGGLAGILGKLALPTSLTMGFKEMWEEGNKFAASARGFNRVFTDNTEEAKKTLSDLATNYHIANTEAMNSLTNAKIFVENLGIVPDKAREISTSIVKLSADISKFYGSNQQDVTSGIESAMAGRYRGLKEYGIVLNDTMVTQKAVQLGLAGSTEEVTAGQKAYAALVLILEKSQYAVGSLARSMETAKGRLDSFKTWATDAGEILSVYFIARIEKALENIAKLKAFIENLKTPEEVSTQQQASEVDREVKRITDIKKALAYMRTDNLSDLVAIPDADEMKKSLNDTTNYYIRLRELKSSDELYKSGKGIALPSVNKSDFLPDKDVSKQAEAEIKKFWEQYHKSVEGEYAFEVAKLDDQKKEYGKFVKDKLALEIWYQSEKKKISVKEYAGGGVEQAGFRSIPEIMSGADNYDAEAKLAKSYKATMDNMQKNAEDFEKNNEELWKKSVTYGEDTLDEWTKLTEQTANAMQQNFSDLFFDAMQGKLKTLSDYANAIFTSIQRAAADMAGQMATEALFGDLGKGASGKTGGGGLLGQIMGMFGGAGGMGTNEAFAGGGSMSGYMAMVKHAGGTVGASGGAMRSIPASYFASAPRLHQGLAADEYPAILQKGEQVVPKGGSKSQPIVHMHFYSQSGKYDRESISQAQSGLYASLSRANRRNS
jgi:hypothetical protein